MNLSAIQVDKEVRKSIVKVKNHEAALAFYLHDVKKRRLWKELRYSSEFHYATVVCGFGRQKIGYMFHFGDKLDKYNLLREAFADGSITWTKVREILKIVTPSSERDLVEKARLLTNRELEALVARTRFAEKEAKRSSSSKDKTSEPWRSSAPCGFSNLEKEAVSMGNEQQQFALDRIKVAPRGANPTPEQKPESRINITFSLTSEEHLIFSRLLKKWKQSHRETPRREDMLRFMVGFCTGHDAFEKGKATEEKSGKAGDGKLYKSPFEIVIHECPECGKSTVSTGMGEYPAEQSLVARAKCDGSEFLPESCGAEVSGPAAVHPTQKPIQVRPVPRGTVTPALRKKIFHRDRGVCRTPGCRHSMFLEIHHIKAISEGGGNDESNMILICAAYHKHVHEKRMKIMGGHPDTEFFHIDPSGCRIPFGESAVA